MTNYLFDVDGTLTPSRTEIDNEFKHFFGDWVLEQQSLNNKVFFVTGSDRDKTVEQVGLPLWRLVDGSYQCCGNQLYKNGKLIKESKWRMSAYLHLDLMLAMERSPWFGKAKDHIEERAGMVNFSTLGRSATTKQRKAYYMWDKAVRERETIANSLSFAYPKLEFSVGGEISIDIHPKGKNKSQVLNDMIGTTVFFGDRCEATGNDFPIASKADVCHHVLDWRETHSILRNEYSEHKWS